MTDAGWALKKVETAPLRDGEDWTRFAARLVKAEHARDVRIVKAEIKRVKMDEHTYTAGFKMTLLRELQALLAKLQRGRGGKG